MKSSKRILCLVLSLCMLLSFVSCGEKEKKTEEETAKTEESTKKDEEFLATFVSDYFDGKYDEKKSFQYEDFSVYFDLASYEGITYPDDPMIQGVVSDQEVEDYLAQIYLASEVADDSYTTLTEGVIQRYDMLTLDYRGVIDGEEVANATAKDQSLLIGSNSFIKGFEEALIGKKAGEEIVLNLSFSPYYHGAEVRGKDITFYVTVKKIQRPTMPEYDVAVVNKAYATSFQTLEEARAWLKEMLTVQAKNNAFSALATYLQDDILARSSVKEYPSKELEHFIDHYKNFYGQYLEDGQTLEDFCKTSLGITLEQFLEEARKYAQGEVAVKLMLSSIAQKEKITCTKEQMSSLIKGIYTSENNGYYGSLESFVKDYITIYGADYFENQVIASAVMEVVTEKAVKEGA